jgi:hypothetical protein
MWWPFDQRTRRRRKVLRRAVLAPRFEGLRLRCEWRCGIESRQALRMQIQHRTDPANTVAAFLNGRNVVFVSLHCRFHSLSSSALRRDGQPREIPVRRTRGTSERTDRGAFCLSNPRTRELGKSLGT